MPNGPLVARPMSISVLIKASRQGKGGRSRHLKTYGDKVKEKKSLCDESKLKERKKEIENGLDATHPSDVPGPACEAHGGVRRHRSAPSCTPVSALGD